MNRLWAFLRNSWRQLTSMRTALILLFLLALAAIPGSVFPQRAVSAGDVAGYFREHPDAAPVLDRLWAFDVFSSPWFAAIYLLLFTSLVGCVAPRLAEHWRAVRRPPPYAPKRLDRLPAFAALPSASPAKLPGWRSVRREEPDGTITIAAEKGYLKEIGNLLFHLALLLILIGFAVGAQWGWHANRILIKDQAFCNTLQQFDEYGLGAFVSPGDLPPFCLELADFQASYLDNGQAESFLATLSDSRTFQVNHPLRLDGASVYLLGHGYAPVLRYTDASGRTQTTVVPFLPEDATLTSEGVAAFPDANGGDRERQIGFEGLYQPTTGIGRSQHPQERDPSLFLIAYQGNLGLDAGIPRSVYELDKSRLAQLGEATILEPGESWTLDDGSTMEFLRTEPWIALSLRHDPGQPIMLVGLIALLAGLPLSLYGQRRRVWLRVHPDGTAEAGGLPRTNYPGFGDEFEKVLQQWKRSPQSS